MTDKIKVAFFDLASCEGCQLEGLNLEKELPQLLEKIEIVNFREASSLKRDDYKIAFIEGSITRKEDEQRLKKIRDNTQILIALGACACSGGLNSIKNSFNLIEMRKKVYGKDYKYPHDFPNAFVLENYLPDNLKDRVYFTPSDRGKEKEIRKFLEKIWGKKYQKKENEGDKP